MRNYHTQHDTSIPNVNRVKATTIQIQMIKLTKVGFPEILHQRRHVSGREQGREWLGKSNG